MNGNDYKHYTIKEERESGHAPISNNMTFKEKAQVGWLRARIWVTLFLYFFASIVATILMYPSGFKIRWLNIAPTWLEWPSTWHTTFISKRYKHIGPRFINFFSMPHYLIFSMRKLAREKFFGRRLAFSAISK